MGVIGDRPTESYRCEDALKETTLMCCQAMSEDSDILKHSHYQKVKKKKMRLVKAIDVVVITYCKNTFQFFREVELLKKKKKKTMTGFIELLGDGKMS